jgi:alpha-L-arabinofuranosidase
MKPENKILLANNYAFCEDWDGMIRDAAGTFEYIMHDYSTPPTYIKRPNYYVRDLYYNHFGDTLLGASVTCGTYTYSGTAIPYLGVNVSKSADGNKLYLMVINKNMTNSITASISLSNFVPASSQNAYVLTGPTVDATNEDNSNPTKVSVSQQAFTVSGNSFNFTFRPFSMTAIELKRN